MCFKTLLKESKIYITIFKFGEIQVRKIGIQENIYEYSKLNNLIKMASLIQN